jgi:hypothetical protein
MAQYYTVITSASIHLKKKGLTATTTAKQSNKNVQKIYKPCPTYSI